MIIEFVKYHGAGNDFILLDGRTLDPSISLTKNMISALCHRQFGIGADGFILLLPSARADFKMLYYNADGNESSLCGNGSRCAVSFAKEVGFIKGGETLFEAVDGLHKAKIHSDGLICLEIHDVVSWYIDKDYIFLDTGSPHMVFFERDITKLDIDVLGNKWRNLSPLEEAGANVNFVEEKEEYSFIRTFERGVEGETLACGTGVTASAIALHIQKGLNSGSFVYNLKALGGDLSVSFDYSNAIFSKVYLTGPTQRVFEGKVKY